jgi:endonuclease/exonuclease/phosphatase family metal-dependent hydrolase
MSRVARTLEHQAGANVRSQLHSRKPGRFAYFRRCFLLGCAARRALDLNISCMKANCSDKLGIYTCAREVLSARIKNSLQTGKCMKDSASANRELIVMTLNVYFGSELGPLFAAESLPELTKAVAKAWADVQATNIPARAVSIAHEIASAQPDVVGLQEIVQWSTGTPGAMSSKFDFLLLILEALRKEGCFYAPIAIGKDLDQAGPLDLNGNFVRFEDRHAVLVRIEPPTQVRPYKIQTQTFSTLFGIASPVMGSLTVPRSWIAIDAMIGDRKFRLVETHMESMDEAVQVAQERELVGALANAESPIVVIGDFNSNGNQQPNVPDNTASYPEMIAAGFNDVWVAVNRDDLGNTCCHSADLRNPVSELSRRLDLILTRGAIAPLSAKLVASKPACRTPSGVWPTDHAGLLAKLRFE